MKVSFAVAATLAFAAVPAASASIETARNADRPALRVDARGWAEVSWTAGGVRRTLLVPPRGRLIPGGRLRGRDVSRAERGVVLPFRRVVRRTPDGRLWALQAWRVHAGGPVQLRFSRWRGAPTEVVAGFVVSQRGDVHRLVGRATFQGRPVSGYSLTPEGKRVRHYAFVDCFACGGATGWKRIVATAIRADGSFVVQLRPDWLGARYRVSVTGPNRGATIAPDAAAVLARP